MKNQTASTLAFIAVALTGLAAFQYALADRREPAGHVTMHGLGDRPSLVAFDLGGANGVERTVLVNSTIVDIGGRRFLGGTVTDKYPDVKVVFPGKVAYVAIDRIAYIQYLDGGNPQDGE